MHSVSIRMNCAVLFGALAGSMTVAQTCDTTYTGASGGKWHTAASWTTNHAPTNSEVACISGGETVLIYGLVCVGGSAPADTTCEDNGDCPGGGTCTQVYAAAQAKAVKVTDGTLTVKAYADLTLCGGSNCADSTVDDRLRLEADGKLYIGQNLTIKGSGGILDGVGYADEHGEILSSPTENNVLTIAPSGGNNSSTATSLAVYDDLVIDVALVNNAYVIANSPRMATILQNGAKSGSGVWQATGSGCLDLDVAVTGSGSWVIDYSTAEIEVNATSECLTGKVTISAGTLDVNQDFISTGHLEMTGGTIDVAASKTARFSGTGGISCGI